LVIGGDVPSTGVVGLDGYDLGSVFQGTLDIEVLLIVYILERPAVAGVLSLPLHENVRVLP